MSLTEREQAVLNAVVANPGATVVVVNTLTGMGHRQAGKILEAFANQGVLSRRTGQRSTSYLYYAGEFPEREGSPFNAAPVSHKGRAPAFAPIRSVCSGSETGAHRWVIGQSLGNGVFPAVCDYCQGERTYSTNPDAGLPEKVSRISLQSDPMAKAKVTSKNGVI